MPLAADDLARMMDLSVVKTDSDLDAVGQLADQAKQLNCVCAYVAPDAKVKASGGVRDLETLIAMYRLGARRFGVNLKAGVRILAQCAALPGASIEV